MPLAHESKLLTELEKKRGHEAFVEAGKKANPFFKLLAEMRDRHQREKGATGTCFEIPVAVFDGTVWTIKVPWDEALLKVEAACYAERKKAEINAELFEKPKRPWWKCWGKKHVEMRVWIPPKPPRRPPGPFGDEECQRCGNPAVTCESGEWLCNGCAFDPGGEGWIDEDEDDEV